MTDALEVQVGERLKALNATVATAESCTGGLIASRLTDISGSSAYVEGGVVSYSNAVKERLLNVSQQTLIDHGAVSEPTAREMALGARALFGVDYAVSVTGIAGPGGGTPEKPVGLTYIGVAWPGGVEVERHVWSGSRTGNKQSSADAAFRLLLKVMSAE
jgi:nicotinamide-nucleotide amidase